MTSLFERIKEFFSHNVSDAISNAPHDASVIVAGVAHTIHDVTIEGARTVSEIESSLAKPVTDTITSIVYPMWIIGGVITLYIVYQIGTTTRAALPYTPQLTESALKVAPLFGAI